MGTASDKQRARYDWTTPDGRKRLDAAVSSLGLDKRKRDAAGKIVR